mmetsp:Transcript_20476/g.46483  ORF Transcript_20476/g.46483 Transcript_20476/m.46483 type:complete len:286 (-) Transcript_20476:151-1008(-)
MTGIDTTLLIIDPQVSFHPGGSLAIPKADDNAERIADLIDSDTKIDRIIVTMDSHYKLHIAHPCFWVDGATKKKHPSPFTLIDTETIERGVWIPRDDIDVDGLIDPKHFSLDGDSFNLLQYCIEYTRRLESSEQNFKLCIWPEHCILGSPGHNVVPSILNALDKWSDKTGKSVKYVYKGQNLLTEAYSAMCAEVPISDDTAFNVKVLQQLLESKRVLICGQALSHCVNFTMRDIAKKWPDGEMERLCLLTDCASSVPGFEASGEKFVQDMLVLGAQVKAAEVFLN